MLHPIKKNEHNIITTSNIGLGNIMGFKTYILKVYSHIRYTNIRKSNGKKVLLIVKWRIKKYHKETNRLSLFIQLRTKYIHIVWRINKKKRKRKILPEKQQLHSDPATISSAFIICELSWLPKKDNGIDSYWFLHNFQFRIELHLDRLSNNVIEPSITCCLRPNIYVMGNETRIHKQVNVSIWPRVVNSSECPGCNI